MPAKEAQARIKINHLLEEAGWRFFDDENGPANVQLEPTVKLTPNDLNALGENFERTQRGAIDFLLLDERGFPLIVLEAKAEDIHPLSAKEQARKYARSLDCRFVILSNGNLHYFWDLERGNPNVVTEFPRPESVVGYAGHKPNRQALVAAVVNDDTIALTQFPTYAQAAGWRNEAERPRFIEANRLRFLRPYQLRAVHAIQREVKKGNDRFLFEMATGTGKTLVAAAVIKLFLRSANAHRVLFLVDRLELEKQAHKQFNDLLKNDYKTVIYKEDRDDWRKAEIVVTTVQSLLFDNKFRRLFSPTDFDLVISDEAHRSIGGNARAVFEYFVGYKLGLTATPRDYLKKYEGRGTGDLRELERRLLLDTYRTFGCAGGDPTFRYSLIDGVKDGFLINPVVVDARSDVTTQLLSDEGYAVVTVSEEGEDTETAFGQRDFEKTFFSEDTNRLLCRTFLAHALRDPISGEIGKSIVFAVSQKHAAKLTQILNELADAMFPGRYNSDFAVQVTSQVAGAQQLTINFAYNNLSGSANFVPGYKTSKTRVCVTVGMMTTGYDCPDILNLALMRPIFSPTDFVQIKGRGTRTHDFAADLVETGFLGRNPVSKAARKTQFKLFDFFANCEYFDEAYNYDEVLKLPAPRPAKGPHDGEPRPAAVYDDYENFDPDRLLTLSERQVGLDGMKVDRMFFQKFEERVTADRELRRLVQEGQWERVVEYVNAHIMDRPEEFFTLERLRRAEGIDRRVPLREFIEKAFKLRPAIKSRDELLDEEFDKLLAEHPPRETSAETTAALSAIRYYFKAYVSDGRVREIIEQQRFSDLNTNPTFTMQDYRAVPALWRKRVPEYVKDYVMLNHFME